MEHTELQTITIATYLRPNELPSENFMALVAELKKKDMLYRVCVCMSSINRGLPDEWTYYYDRENSKYMRIKYLLSCKKDRYILSIDNDVALNIPQVVVFCRQMILSGASLGYGRIGVSNNRGLAKLIAVDKVISHHIIRPFLWKINCGASIPGQCFMIRCSDYNDLPTPDTMLDDLQIGMFTRKKRLRRHVASRQLGQERAKETFFELLTQRKRWAKGFAQTLKTSCSCGINDFFIVAAHGVAYHVMPIFFALLVLFFFFIMPWAGLILLSIYIATIGCFNFSLIPAALGYIVIFPIIHLFWLFHFFISIGTDNGQ